jgi:hypothetical protein
LVGNIADHADNGIHLPGTFTQCIQCRPQMPDFLGNIGNIVGQTADRLGRMCRGGAGFAGCLFSHRRIVGNVIDADGDLLDGGCGSAGHLGLPLGLARHVGDLLQAVQLAIERNGMLAHINEHAAQACHKAVECFRGLADFILLSDMQLVVRSAWPLEISSKASRKRIRPRSRRVSTSCANAMASTPHSTPATTSVISKPATAPG